MFSEIEFYKNNYNLIPRNEYFKLELSDETKHILCEIGLPKNPTSFLEFEILEKQDLHYKGYIRIGNDGGTYICIDENDCIVSVDPYDEYPIRYVNKNLKSLIEFICIFSKSSIDNQGTSTDILEDKLKICDESALDSDENWWPIILEQVEDGFL